MNTAERMQRKNAERAAGHLAIQRAADLAMDPRFRRLLQHEYQLAYARALARFRKGKKAR